MIIPWGKPSKTLSASFLKEILHISSSHAVQWEGLPRPSRCEPMFWLNLLISAFLHLSVFPPPSYPLQWDTTPRTPTGHWPGDPKFINMGHFFPVCTVYLIHWWPQNLLLIETLRKKVHSEGIDSQKFYLTHKLVVSDRSLVFLQTAKVYWGQQKKYGVKMQDFL